MKTWLVVGGGGGLGRAIVAALLERGETVHATTRRLATLANLTRENRGSLHVHTLDLEDTTAIGAVSAAACAAMAPAPDVLVNCAGYMLVGAVEECSPAQLQRYLAVNLLAPMLLIKAVLPFMREARRGVIVQVSSEIAQFSLPALSAYQASKWGIEGFCESLRQEVAPFGIRVIVAEPGRVRTPLDDNAEMSDQTLAAYQATIVGRFRMLSAMGKFKPLGDSRLVAQALIDAALDPTVPGRLILGSDAFRHVTSALEGRLSEVQAQRGAASRTDGAPSV